MTHSTAQEGGASTRRRPESPEPQLTPARRRDSHLKPASSTIVTRSRARAAQPQQSPGSYSQSAPEPAWERSTKRRKGTRATVTSSKGEGRNAADEEEEEGEEDVASAASSLAPDETSSANSSPLREPLLHYEVIGYSAGGEEIYRRIKDLNIIREYNEEAAKCRGKLERQMDLPTLDQRIPYSFLDEPELVVTRAAATKTILCAAKSVLALTSRTLDDGNQLPQCSGFLIDWDDASKTGTVVTTADSICSSKSMTDWSGKDVYSPDAEVTVHLLDNTTVTGCFRYYQKDYNLAFFEISVDQPIQLLDFNPRVEYAQEVFLLGRDESLYLTISHGRVLYCDSNLNNRHHYMTVGGRASECVTGGPVIDLNGKVVGMASIYAREALIPSFIILKCWHFWKRYGCIPRPHLGLKFSAIKFRSIPQIDRISRVYKIEDGLIVREVSHGSTAEKHGLRVGDIITCLNGECISDTVELENLLLCMSEDHFDKGKRLDSKMDVNIGVYRTRKHMHNNAHKDITLSVIVSDRGEVVSRDSYLIPPEPPSGKKTGAMTNKVQRWLHW